MKVEIAINGRFRVLPQAAVSELASNCWEVQLPLGPPLSKWVRGKLPDALDGVVLALDEQECEPALVTASDARTATLTVYAL